MSPFITSVIRTTVPYIVSAIVSFLTVNGVDVSDDTKVALASVLTTLLGNLYYIVVRKLELKYPEHRWGLLLGSESKPTYDSK